MSSDVVGAATSGVVLTVRQVARRPLDVMLTTSLVIGRDCDGLLIADPQASRRHVEFRLIDGRVTVQDLGSANGTLLEGTRIIGETFLDVGATVVAGTTSVTIGRPSGAVVAVQPTTYTERPKSSIMLLSEAMGAGVHVGNPARRTGTFTIVFSDIEGSTRYATQVGDEAWMKILDRHESLIRRAADEHGGRIIKNQGDGFMLTFESARRAVAFSVAVQQRLEAERVADPAWDVRVRVGLHAGEAIATSDGDLFGRHVMVASRIADQAEGGEIVASAIVRELTSGSVEFEFDDGRPVVLKGIGEQVIHRITWRTTVPDS